MSADAGELEVLKGPILSRVVGSARSYVLFFLAFAFLSAARQTFSLDRRSPVLLCM